MTDLQWHQLDNEAKSWRLERHGVRASCGSYCGNRWEWTANDTSRPYNPSDPLSDQHFGSADTEQDAKAQAEAVVLKLLEAKSR